MARFVPSKKVADDFNDGNQYISGDGNTTGDIIDGNDINNVIESALYSQNVAESANQTAQGALSEVNQVLADKTLLPDVQKNYYNLGKYDTFVSNGDGTGTVTRKTGVQVYNSGDVKKASWLSYTNVDYYYIPKPEAFIGYNTTSNTRYSTNKFPIGSGTDTAANIGKILASMSGAAFYIGFSKGTTLTQAQQAISGLIVEYELSSTLQDTEQVIENQPIRHLNQDGENWLDNEYKKGLNLFNAALEQGTFNPSTGALSPSTTRVRSAAVELDAGTYTVSVKGVDNVVVYVYNTDGTYNSTESFTDWSASNYRTFVLSQNSLVRFGFRYADNGTINVSDIQGVMLTRGTIAYPYAPYSGNIVHESDMAVYVENTPVPKTPKTSTFTISVATTFTAGTIYSMGSIGSLDKDFVTGGTIKIGSVVGSIINSTQFIALIGGAVQQNTSGTIYYWK